MIVSTALFAQEPDWLWAEKAGGSDWDEGYGISTDADGNSYITGQFKGTASFGSFTLTSIGDDDIFVAKISADGNWLWAENAGGSFDDNGYGISISVDGNVYVTGYFQSTASFGSFTLTSSGHGDIFVAKMDAAGNWLWAEKAGGSYYDYGRGISISADGNLYVTGWFNGTASFGYFTLTSSGNDDIFVAKMDAAGNWLWAEKAGGISNDYGRVISTDADGNVYVTGYFFGTASFGSFTLTSSGNTDIFVAKMDADGNWLWAEKAGGSDWDKGYGISTDADGNVYVTGYFKGLASFGSFNLTSSGSCDVFLAKISADGNWLWAKKAGGSSLDTGYGISTSADGNVYVTGYFFGTASFGSFTLNSSGGGDIFVAKMDADGNWLWAKKAGGSDYDSGYGISISTDGNVYVTGYFYSITAIFGSFTLTSSGEYDIFVAKLNSSVSVENEIILTEIELSNYPNPFNPETTISFSIPKISKVEISIYNIKGQKIKTLTNESFQRGYHEFIWNGRDENGIPVSSGIYFYKIETDNFSVIKKCILLK